MTADEVFAKIQWLYAALRRAKPGSAAYNRLVVAIRVLSDLLNKE